MVTYVQLEEAQRRRDDAAYMIALLAVDGMPIRPELAAEFRAADAELGAVRDAYLTRVDQPGITPSTV